jgi:YspA, cpYpsA-related SLOG family
MNVCINGSRTFHDFNKMLLELAIHLPKSSDLKLILGGAKGADTLAHQYAIMYRIPYKIYPADWNKFGKSAGFKRNEEMIDISDRLISFWDGESNGTKHTIQYAISKNLSVTVIYI